MSAKGWQLVNWQPMLLIFEQTEPKEQQHRIVSPDGSCGGAGMDSWREAGWQPLLVDIRMQPFNRCIILKGEPQAIAPFDWPMLTKQLAESDDFRSYQKNWKWLMFLTAALCGVILWLNGTPSSLLSLEGLTSHQIGLMALTGLAAIMSGLDWRICRQLKKAAQGEVDLPKKLGRELVVGRCALWMVVIGLMVKVWIGEMVSPVSMVNYGSMCLSLVLTIQLLIALYRYSEGMVYMKGLAVILVVLLCLVWLVPMVMSRVLGDKQCSHGRKK